MMLGKKLAGRYEIIEKIGQGGMARVYRGLDLLLNRIVAIKIFKDQMTEDPDFVKRFRREAQAAARLSHPNIVNIYDVGHDEDTYYIIMENVNGPDLKSYIKEKGRLSAGEAVSVARQIAEALVQAHAAGLIHRDIKPQNIIFSNCGTVKVTDFGIALAADGNTVTRGDAIFGSVHYLPPEQARGSLVGEQSDLYSLGIVLYEMITGRVPFSGDSPLTVAMKHLQEMVIPPHQIARDLPEPLERIILKAVEKNPSRRYQSARELLQDLILFQSKGTAQAVPGADPDEQETIEIDLAALNGARHQQASSKPRSRRRWPLLLLVMIILSGSLLAGLITLRNFIIVPEVVVPDLRETALNEAVTTLEELGLRYTVRWAPHETVISGKVISLEPSQGRTVRLERVIELLVSEGPEHVRMPQLQGRTEMEAMLILQEAGLYNFLIQREHHEDIPQGRIIRQAPNADFPISPENDVVIYVSLGGRPFAMGNLIGLSREAALEYIAENGLRAGKVQYMDSEIPAGTVISQFPVAGSNIQPGQPVDLVISKNGSDVA